MNVKYNTWNCILWKFTVNRQIKDENVTIFFKKLAKCNVGIYFLPHHSNWLGYNSENHIKSQRR